MADFTPVITALLTGAVALEAWSLRKILKHELRLQRVENEINLED